MLITEGSGHITKFLYICACLYLNAATYRLSYLKPVINHLGFECFALKNKPWYKCFQVLDVF